MMMEKSNALRLKDGMKVNRTVFFSATLLIGALMFFSVVFPVQTEHLFVSLQREVLTNASWFYVLAVAIILCCAIFLLLSQYGDIKLGPDHATPDYSNTAWFAMLFSAGMGIGLMFFGVAEPVLHFIKPPIGQPMTVEAARQAMQITFFHWGLHAWAIYAMVGLILAYFSFRHNQMLTLRSALFPILGERVNGKLGDAVDVFAILSTVFGIATSLGYGVEQVSSGFHYLYDLPDTLTTQLVLIVIITLIAGVSVVTGLDKGIKRLSQLNLLLAVALLAFLFLFGSSIFLLKAFIQNIGAYLSGLVSKTFNLYAYQKNFWIGGWTLLYWAWWLSWAPFVGMFIAKISRGRTIREFLLGVILVPTFFTFLWMTILGNSALNLILNKGYGVLATTVEQSTSMALFKFLEYFPFSGLVCLLAVIMVIVFFVTSFDSGALVLDSLSSNGQSNTPRWQRIYWTGIEGLIACTLLSLGGLQALQSATIVAALPFTLIVLMACFGLFKALRIEGLRLKAYSNTQAMIPVGYGNGDNYSFKQRIDALLSTPGRKAINAFIEQKVIKALQLVAQEFTDKGLSVQVEKKAGFASLTLFHGEEIDFFYAVRLKEYLAPSFSAEAESSNKACYRAEVYLTEGGQNYDVMGYKQMQLINDVLDNYERHLHFLDVIR